MWKFQKKIITVLVLLSFCSGQIFSFYPAEAYAQGLPEVGQGHAAVLNLPEPGHPLMVYELQEPLNGRSPE